MFDMITSAWDNLSIMERVLAIGAFVVAAVLLTELIF